MENHSAMSFQQIDFTSVSFIGGEMMVINEFLHIESNPISK